MIESRLPKLYPQGLSERGVELGTMPPYLPSQDINHTAFEGYVEVYFANERPQRAGFQ